ncbi:MAG: hypothetical protein ACXU9L_02475 [Thermodesulfobacteriota bacterium]
MQNLEHFLWAKITDILPVDPKTFGVLVAILFLLTSFLFNLLQRRRSRTRLDRLLENDKSVVNLLGVIDEYLGKLERSCAFELREARSPQQVGKAIYVVRDKIKATIVSMEENLRSYDHHRRKEKRQKNQRKRLNRSLKKQPGRQIIQ